MTEPADLDPNLAAIDRHALVMAIWMPAGLAAAALAHFGLGAGGGAALLGSSLTILAAFIGHVIVNVITGSRFTARERGLGLVLYAAALLGFAASRLAAPGLWAGREWATVASFLLLFAAVVFHLVTTFGVRGAFDSFDIIRSFRAEPGRAGRRSP